NREPPNGYATRAWDGIADRRLGLERVRARRRADRRDALERGRAGGTLLDEVDRAAHRNVIPVGEGVEHDRDRGPRGDVTDQRLDGRALERVVQVIEQIAVDVADHIALAGNDVDLGDRARVRVGRGQEERVRIDVRQRPGGAFRTQTDWRVP